jgi:hypothetical protein
MSAQVLENEKAVALKKEQRAMEQKEKLLQDGEKDKESNEESSHMAGVNNKRMQKQLCELKDKNVRLEEEVEELQKQNRVAAVPSGNKSMSAVMEGLDGATKKHAERIRALEGDLESTRLQLAAETNSRLEAERELKKMKGETEPSARRSNRARRGALEPVNVEAVPTATTNVQASEEAPVKEVTAQKENAGAAMPVRRSLRSQKTTTAVTGGADPAAAGQDPENCKQQ